MFPHIHLSSNKLLTSFLNIATHTHTHTHHFEFIWCCLHIYVFRLTTWYGIIYQEFVILEKTDYSSLRAIYHL